MGKVKGKEYGEGLVKDAVSSMIRHFKIPFRSDSAASQGGMGDVWQTSAEELHQWLLTESAEAVLQLYSSTTPGTDSAQKW